ncbi:MAG: hypothetical protein WKG00_12105 [Polyangiaceae bacterium]
MLLACLGATSTTLGCGMMTAVTNPSAAFAIQEPSSLSVVVRRAEIARATSNEVDRLLGATPVAESSTWPEKVALKVDDATALMKTASGEQVYAGSQARVVPAEAWAHGLAGVCSDGSSYPNLIAASGPDAAKLYGEIVAEKRSIGKLKTALAKEEAAGDADGLSDAKKAEHDKKGEALEADIDKLTAANEAKVDKLVELLKKPSPAPGPLKEKLKTAATNLRAAVKDATIANSAAVLGFPMALSGITTDAQKAAGRFVADVVEDKTGTRPDTSTLKPDVKLEGTDVKLTLNGLTKEQLGSLDIGGVVSATPSRLGGSVALALTVPGSASETSDLLSLQATLLDAYLAGLGGPGTPVELGATPVVATAPNAPPAANTADKERPRGKRWTGGLLIASACVPAKDDDTTVVAAVVPAAGGAGAAAASKPAPATGAAPAAASKPAPEPAAEPVAEAAVKPEAEPAAEPEPTASENTPAEPSSGSSTGRTIGWVSLAVGGAGLGVGAVLGVLAATKHRDLVQQCGGTDCPPTAYGSVDEYHTLGTASTVSLVAGGGAAALGLVLVVASPSSSPARVERAGARSFPGSVSDPWAPREVLSDANPFLALAGSCPPLGLRGPGRMRLGPR